MNQKSFKRQKSIKTLILQNELELLFYLKHFVNRVNKTETTFLLPTFYFIGNITVSQQFVAYAFQICHRFHRDLPFTTFC